MRDRLIELLCNIECNGEDWNNGGCALRKNERCIKIDNLDMCMIGCIADILLANGVIVQTPGEDVVEVVRCRDCVYFREDESICMRHFSMMYGAGFCSLGKRKEQP